MSDRHALDSAAAGPVVAFFDLDGTLVIGQTQALLVRFLHRAGIVSRGFMLGTGLWFVAYKAGLVRVTQKSREKGARFLAGRTEREVDDLMDRFTDEVLVPGLRPAVSGALGQHLAEGTRVVVLSAALEPLVKSLCHRLGVADYVGAPCERTTATQRTTATERTSAAVLSGGGAAFPHGGDLRIFTGRLSGPTPYGEEKARIARTLLERWGAEPTDCWAYADHDTDLPLLRSVGHPVAVSPKPALLAAARRAGWPVLS